ncbi:hypothetical protein [Serratia marcescens]|uniref:hypothetical protein n=1 Tax=Serratia marcescens TaxID=615 RepID=UPI001F14E6F0|nr:hypothetical protein [Serratia marcescens]
MKAETKKEIVWHLKNALTKKFILLPFIAPCYVALFVWNYLGLYLSYFIKVVMLKTTKERDEYFAKVRIEMDDTNGKAIFAFYALTMTMLYWFLFGFSHELTGLQVLNFPTYFLTALPIEAIYQLATLPAHYVK